jgi:hypothetical protein
MTASDCLSAARHFPGVASYRQASLPLTARAGPRRLSPVPRSTPLKTCEILERVPEEIARRAASLQAQAKKGSAVDALVVAAAEPGGGPAER